MSSGFIPQPPPELPRSSVLPKQESPSKLEPIPTPTIEIEAVPEQEPIEPAPTLEKSRTENQPVSRPTPTAIRSNTPAIPHSKDDITRMVEKILSEGFEDVYKELSITEQQAFKIKGEQTAHSIRELLRETKVKVGKIFRLIYSWLKMLPGINTFFLEQEAKIKADKIAALRYHDPDHWVDPR